MCFLLENSCSNVGITKKVIEGITYDYKVRDTCFWEKRTHKSIAKWHGNIFFLHWVSCCNLVHSTGELVSNVYTPPQNECKYAKYMSTKNATIMPKYYFPPKLEICFQIIASNQKGFAYCLLFNGFCLGKISKCIKPP